MADTRRITEHRVEVIHVAKPMRKASGATENGPHLSDLREFVAACDQAEIDGDELVWIDKSNVSEGGHRSVTFRTVQRRTVGTAEEER